MMKILHIVDYLMPTMGYQEFLLPKWNAKQGHDVTIITSDRYFPVPNYNDTWLSALGPRVVGSGIFQIDGVTVIRLPLLFEIKSRPLISNIYSTISNINPDVILCHGTGSFSTYLSARSAKKLSIPIFFDNHMIFDIIQSGFLQNIYYFFIKNFFSSYVSRIAVKVIGVTAESCDYLHKCEGYKKSVISHLPLGIDHEIFYLNKEYMPDFSLKKIIITQSGKLNNDKKPQWLAEAVILLLHRGYDVELHFVGSGSTEIIDNMRNLFIDNHFLDRFHLHDLMSLPDLADFYRRSHFVVFPEGTSLSALEASACGSIAIMADHPASIDRHSSGIGVLYPRGNIELLSYTISDLIESPSTAKKVQLESSSVVLEKYSYSSISTSFINLFKAVSS